MSQQRPQSGHRRSSSRASQEPASCTAGANGLDWDRIEKQLHAIPPDFKSQKFNSLKRVIEILSRDKPQWALAEVRIAHARCSGGAAVSLSVGRPAPWRHDRAWVAGVLQALARHAVVVYACQATAATHGPSTARLVRQRSHPRTWPATLPCLQMQSTPSTRFVPLCSSSRSSSAASASSTLSLTRTTSALSTSVVVVRVYVQIKRALYGVRAGDQGVMHLQQCLQEDLF
jgi:hypothetical protein